MAASLTLDKIYYLGEYYGSQYAYLYPDNKSFQVEYDITLEYQLATSRVTTTLNEPIIVEANSTNRIAVKLPIATRSALGSLWSGLEINYMRVTLTAKSTNDADEYSETQVYYTYVQRAPSDGGSFLGATTWDFNTFSDSSPYLKGQNSFLLELGLYVRNDTTSSTKESIDSAYVEYFDVNGVAQTAQLTKTTETTPYTMGDLTKWTCPVTNMTGQYITVVMTYTAQYTSSYSNTTTHRAYIHFPMEEYFKPYIAAQTISSMTGDGSIEMEFYGGYDAAVLPAGGSTNTLTITGQVYAGPTYIKNIDCSNYSIKGNSFSGTTIVSGLDYQTGYTFKFFVNDLYADDSYDLIVVTEPLFHWDNNDFKFNIPVSFMQGINVNGLGTPETPNIIVAEDSIGDTTIGYPHYSQENGNTNIYGNEVNIFAHNRVFINGNITGTGNKVLWSGASHMNGNQSITLNEAIGLQEKGIVLVFSLYRNGAAEDVSINSFFVSKHEVALLPGAPHTFMMNINAGFSGFGAKYLYIDQNTITGHETNTASGANSGVTYDNSKYVLRYVIGV